MMHTTPLRSTTDVEWHQVWFAMPAWLGHSIWVLALILTIAAIAVSVHLETLDEPGAIAMIPKFIMATVAFLIAALIVSGSSLGATKEANKKNLEEAYGVNLYDSSEEFLVHGTDTTIRGYKLQGGKSTNITFRVQLTEHDGVTRGKLLTVNKDGSTREVSKAARLNLDGEVDMSSTEASGAAEDQGTKPNKSSGLSIRDSEVREYLNSVTRSEEILNELRIVNERLTKLESK